MIVREITLIVDNGISSPLPKLLPSWTAVNQSMAHEQARDSLVHLTFAQIADRELQC